MPRARGPTVHPAGSLSTDPLVCLGGDFSLCHPRLNLRYCRRLCRLTDTVSSFPAQEGGEAERGGGDDGAIVSGPSRGGGGENPWGPDGVSPPPPLSHAALGFASHSCHTSPLRNIAPATRTR